MTGLTPKALTEQVLAGTLDVEEAARIYQETQVEAGKRAAHGQGKGGWDKAAAGPRGRRQAVATAPRGSKSKHEGAKLSSRGKPGSGSSHG